MENEFFEKAPDIEDIAVLSEIKEGNFLILATNLVRIMKLAIL